MKNLGPILTTGKLLVTLGLVLFLSNCTNRMKITTLPYPETRMDETVDDYHGTLVADPYRWLEDDNSPETAQWVNDQNKVTYNYLEQIPYRDKIKERLTELWNYPKNGLLSKHGDYYYYNYNDGLQNQSIMYRKKTLDGQEEVFFDPNKLSEDGTTALSATSFSEDGKYFAYAVSVAGSDWVEIKVLNTETMETLTDLIKWVKFSAASWDADSKGFYYSRYDEPAKGSELSAQNQYQKVYYHKLGDEQSKDKLVYGDPKHPLRYFNGWESRDGKYIFIRGREGTNGTEVLFKKVNEPMSAYKVLLPGFSNDYSIVDCRDDKLFVYSNEDAPNYKITEIDLLTGKATRDLIPENPDMYMDNIRNTGGYYFVTYLEDAKQVIYQYDHAGEVVRTVDLPQIGTVSGFGGKKEATETFYSISSYTTPGTIYKYDIATGQSEVYKTPEVIFDPSLYVTEQLFFESKDGTRVPMFVTHRKDIKLNGKNPLLLYGYGGFNNNQKPGFNPRNIMFMEQGGVYAVVNLRGGSEYGEKWHRDGMLDKKQNVFDDFIAAAEYLIEKKYTSKEKLAINGGSNGGLLVGACMTQRPDLYAVALPAVGVMDMLRFHKFTVGWGWVAEYGSSEDPDQFEYLYKYSPLHNIKDGVCYPATMITTADHDDRVVPAHSFKFAAELQKAQGCDNPALIRIAQNAGHGAGKPTSMVIQEAADMFSFIFWNTDTKVNFK